ncbi:MAG: bifunctional 5,10-methylenetetrahydrofolate dehydrogenase/5,10-methenyltetrahydrofolate cyclohydrolase [archaeon]
MPAALLDGLTLSKSIEETISKKVSDFKQKNGIIPCLAVILAGNNAASELYVRKKQEACKNVGINSLKFYFAENVSEEELLKKVEEINSDKKIHAAIIQLPLPKHINKTKILNALCPYKDADGFTCWNLGRTLQGEEEFLPATVQGIITLLEHYKIDLKGKHAVIVGHSLIVGRPLAEALLNRNATVTVCHKETKNLANHAKLADILISAVGKPNLITAKMVKKGAVVIDVGTTKVGNKLFGDIDFKNVKKKASFITPVPGGVGPMTVSSLLENTLKCAEKLR